ncbi:MAG: hypothetical protein KIT25_04440 [Enhydrobacter sp.]|nr:MAG: hypothetical protein KIT25_04440 [Enhydrobacter sp.]
MYQLPWLRGVAQSDDHVPSRPYFCATTSCDWAIAGSDNSTMSSIQRSIDVSFGPTDLPSAGRAVQR